MTKSLSLSIKKTLYKVVDKNNPTYDPNKTDKTAQTYKPNGNEVELASYSITAMEGQNFTASGERQFELQTLSDS